MSHVTFNGSDNAIRLELIRIAYFGGEDAAEVFDGDKPEPSEFVGYYDNLIDLLLHKEYVGEDLTKDQVLAIDEWCALVKEGVWAEVKKNTCLHMSRANDMAYAINPRDRPYIPGRFGCP
jgi:hypothetical protein